jgi:hypothetical protein
VRSILDRRDGPGFIKTKKGQGGEMLGFLLMGVMTVFLLFLLAVPMAVMWDQTSAALKNDTAFGSDEKTVEQIERVDTFVTPLMDQVVFIALIGFILVLLVVAVFTEIHPIFLVFLGLGVIVIAIIASQLINVTDDALNNAKFDGKKAEFTFSSALIGTGFPLLILVVGAVAIIIMMNKSKGGGA